MFPYLYYDTKSLNLELCNTRSVQIWLMTCFVNQSQQIVQLENERQNILECKYLVRFPNIEAYMA
jgi:hypothetical protein